MKKLIRNISLVATLVMMLVSCVEKDPEYTTFPSKDVDFTYAVAGDQYLLDYYVVSDIQFTNTSAKQGPITWDFGDGQTSNEANPIHKYAKAGVYKVKLTIDGVGSREYPLMVYDIAPVLSIKEQSADVITIKDVSVDFDIFLPNPQNLKVKYEWSFPEGTLNEEGQVMTSFTGFADAQGNVEYPGKLRFSNIGSQRITLKTWFDVDGENRQLSDSYVNVQVGADKEYSTVYFATIGGNVKAMKIIPEEDLPEGTKNLPFDMGVRSGVTPFNLVFADVKDAGGDVTSWIYILDCGKQYTYINDEAGVQGDGKINVMSPDGTATNLFVSNVGQGAFFDPYFGMVDGEYLLYTDRNAGIRKAMLTTRGEKEKNDYFVENDGLAYYNKSMSYGAISCSLYKDKAGVYYWGKCFNGEGIYRFRTSDIGKDYKTNPEPNKVILPSTTIKGFTIDEKRGKLYVWRTLQNAGFYAYDLPADQTPLGRDAYNHKFLLDADPLNATATEGAFVTQMAVDTETGNVWFGFNRDPKDPKPVLTTGLKYFDYETSKIVDVPVVTDKILGITINSHKAKLF